MKRPVMATLGIVFAALLLITYAQALNVADRVLGQVDYTHRTINLIDGRGIDHAWRVTIDRSVTPNHIYVSDFNNNRILGWSDASSFVSGDPATLVIGQPDINSTGVNAGRGAGAPTASTLNGPNGMAVDAAGNLYVADTNNNRVLEYNSPFDTDTVADSVFGQGGFTTGYCAAVTASTICQPYAVAVDGNGNLYAADSNNNRVLGFAAPLVSGSAASIVFGQTNFTSNAVNNGGVSASTLYAPRGLAVDGLNNLYIADVNNNRVLKYNTPFSTDQAADLVIGQPNFTTISTNANNGATAYTLRRPYDVAIDPLGNVYVADNGNSRALAYAAPSTNDPAASLVFGQGGSFTTTQPYLTNIDANTLGTVTGIATDGAGNAYIVDYDNNRVLEFDSPFSSDTTADRVLGQPDFTHNGINYVDGSGLYNPSGVALDFSVSPPRLYAADAGNGRVLAWSDASAFASGAPADLVLGEPDMNTRRDPGACNQPTVVSAATLCNPRAVAVDSTGNVYVADTNDNRVLEYDTPFTSDTTADRVFGQSDFITIGQNYGGISNISLSGPNAVAVDAAGNLYVSDFYNSRVLVYLTPLTSDSVADVVFGQGGSFNTGTCNMGTGIASADSLCNPSGVAVNSTGDLYISDTNNSRILAYQSPLTTDTTADFVIGQADMTGNLVNGNGSATPSDTSLNAPRGIAVDRTYDDLYVADTGNSRGLVFSDPITTDAIADEVFGQEVFTTGTCANTVISESTLCHPYGLTAYTGGGLFVSDTDNHRILTDSTFSPYKPPVANDTTLPLMRTPSRPFT